MPWFQMTIPFAADYTPTQEAVLPLLMTHKANPDIALMTRNVGTEQVLLLHVPTSDMARLIPGKWEEAPDVTDHVWTVLVANGDPWEHFGLRKP